MGTTLTGTTPQDTYDSLIKVTDNGPISGTLKALSDGLGNDSTLSLSTTAASIAGTLSVTGNATFDTDTLFVDVSAGNVGINTTTPVGPLEVVLPARTNEDTNAQHAIFGSGTSGNGIRIGYNSANNIGFVSALKPASAWSDLELEGASIRFAPTGTERVRVTADGLTFNGDTAAANALDDYEEGTFTPVLSDGTNNATMDVGSVGFYTKIGRVVYCSFTVYTSSLGSVSGNLQVTGLPFATGASFGPSVFTTSANQFLNVLLGQFISGRVLGGSTSIQLWLNDSTAGMTEMQSTEWSADGYANFTGYYFV
jgi:hypothetical protein